MSLSVDNFWKPANFLEYLKLLAQNWKKIWQKRFSVLKTQFSENWRFQFFFALPVLSPSPARTSIIQSLWNGSMCDLLTAGHQWCHRIVRVGLSKRQMSSSSFSASLSPFLSHICSGHPPPSLSLFVHFFFQLVHFKTMSLVRAKTLFYTWRLRIFHNFFFSFLIKKEWRILKVFTVVLKAHHDLRLYNLLVWYLQFFENHRHFVRAWTPRRFLIKLAD